MVGADWLRQTNKLNICHVVPLQLYMYMPERHDSRCRHSANYSLFLNIVTTNWLSFLQYWFLKRHPFKKYIYIFGPSNPPHSWNKNSLSLACEWKKSRTLNIDGSLVSERVSKAWVHFWRRFKSLPIRIYTIDYTLYLNSFKLEIALSLSMTCHVLFMYIYTYDTNVTWVKEYIFGAVLLL